MQETWVRSLGQEDPLEEEMATHTSVLAWRIPWTEEPGGSFTFIKRLFSSFSLSAIGMTNANQNCNEASPHTSQNDHHQKKSTNNTCWRECGEKGTLLHYWSENKLVPPVMRTAWRFLKILKIELLYDPAVPLLSIYPGKTWSKKIHTPKISL